MGVDHPGLQTPITEWDRRMRRIARASIQNASIGRAGIRVYDGGWIVIENGGLEVEGLARVVGELEGTGTLNWWGPWFLRGNGTVAGNQNVTGETTYTGKVTINGPWKFVGNGEITGDVNLTGELTAGNVKISPSTAGGQIGFGSGRQINAGSGFLGIYDGSRFIVFNSTGVTIHGGGATVTVSSSGVRLNLPKVTKAGIPSGCVYVGSDGYAYEG